MEATIRVVNLVRGMFAAEIDGDGSFVIFELLDTATPEIGDVVSHQDFYSMGGEVFSNLTQGCKIDVFVQNICGESLVREQCFLP